MIFITALVLIFVLRLRFPKGKSVAAIKVMRCCVDKVMRWCCLCYCCDVCLTHCCCFLVSEAIAEALTSSEVSTLQVFQASYPRLLPHVKPVLHAFFSELKGFIDVTDTSSLEQTLSKFWDDLFPVVYHSAVHAKMSAFTPTYADCIRKSQRTIRPWGIVPALVNEPIVRAVESSTLLLHALHVGSRVVESAENYELPPECHDTTTRMASCGLCHGVTEPPCLNLCLNVARGCLAPLTEIGAGWTDWVNGVARAGKALKTARSVFQRLSDHLPDAVLVAMETGPKLQKKVSAKWNCLKLILSKDYCITGRANPIFCAVGLR